MRKKPPKSLWDQLGDTFEAAKTLSGKVSEIFGAYSTGKSVLQALGIMASDPSLTQVWDDLKRRLADIEAKLDAYYKALEDEILGVGHIVLRQAVAEALAKSLERPAYRPKATSKTLPIPNASLISTMRGLWRYLRSRS